MSPWMSIRASLEPPVFPDPAETIRAANIHYVSLAIFLVNFIGIPLIATTVGFRPATHLISMVMMLACYGCMALGRRGRLALAGNVLAASLWLANTVLVSQFGMLLGVSFGGYLGIVIVAGLVAGTRGAVLTAVGSSAVGAWLAINPGPSVLATPNIAATWSGWTLYAGLMAGLMATTNRTIQSALSSVEESRERFRLLTEGTRDLVSEFESDGTLLYASPNHADVVGRLPADLVGRNVYEHAHPDDRDRLSGENAPTTLRTEQIPVSYQHADGHWLQLEIDTLAYRTANRDLRVMAISRDVTERNHLEEQLRQSQRLESVGRLAGGIAHDFNNLLTVIQGYTQFLQRTDTREELQEIADAAGKASELICRLLIFSRRQALQPRVIEVNDVVRGVEPIIGRLIGEDVSFELALCDDEAHVLADPAQLEQVLMNLVVNARDAMPNGGRMRIQTRTERPVTTANEDDGAVDKTKSVEISVEDSGEGMDEETLAHIFDPFFSTKGEGVGTGLGLSTVHGVVTQTGGSIEVDTKPGEGATFKVHLPRTDEALTRRERQPRAPQPRSIEGVTVLIVEDNAPLRHLLRRSLIEEGCRVIEAEDGAHALELASVHADDIDIVVTDLIMPKMGGAELSRGLKEQHPGLRTLFMTGYDASASENDETSPTPTLLKPFAPADLVARIREILDEPPA